VWVTDRNYGPRRWGAPVLYKMFGPATAVRMLSFILILCTIPFAYSQACDGTTCSTCTAQQNCGWCAATDSCLGGISTGPNASVCHQTSWFFSGTNPCPDCSSLIGCTACTDNAACGWIAATESCGDVTATGASGYCPCDEYDQCTDCVRAGCTFCSSMYCRSRTS